MSNTEKYRQFIHDGLVLHSEDELPSAHCFCEYVQKLDIGDGQRPDILTMESFSHPGKTMVQNLNDAISSARLIFCTEEYYHVDAMGNFSGDVAIIHKIPDRFIKLKIKGQKRPSCGSSSLPSSSSLHGLQLGPNWEVEEHAHQKLLKLFCNQFPSNNGRGKIVTQFSGPVQRQQGEGMRSLPSDDNLEVMNPSISSTSSLQSLASQDETEPKLLAGDYHSESSQEPQAHDSLKGHSLAMSDLMYDNGEELERNGEEVFENASDNQRPWPTPPHSSVSQGLQTQDATQPLQLSGPQGLNPNQQSMFPDPPALNPGPSGQDPKPSTESLTSVAQLAAGSAAANSPVQAVKDESARAATVTVASGRDGRCSPDGAYASLSPGRNDLQSQPIHLAANADKDEEKKKIEEQIKQLQQKLRDM
ncbi:uncharacterized protein [Littorina saxatilis]|uniref:Uncharacterized protein n=1 Tax=Littorina saxatilis TaxID=31220 RepID=A0AAN9GPQ2_9CAEN